MNPRLEAAFPKLAGTVYAVTSDADPGYNCLAWAAGDSERWWRPSGWPVSYWPAGAPLSDTIDSIEAAFVTLGFVRAEHAECEAGIEKVALYADPEGKPTHAARQLPDGSWTSKLGRGEDISHTLDATTGSHYGRVVRILQRPAR